MNFKTHQFVSYLCVIGAMMIVSGGCDSGPDIATMVGENNKTNIQKLLNGYTLYQRRMKNEPCPGKEELLDFIRTNGSIDKNLSYMNIDKDKFEDYFVSERDNEEFLVRWGIYQAERMAAEPVIFEKTGFEGKFQVIWTGGEITEVGKDEYDKLMSNNFERDEFVQPAFDSKGSEE